MRMEKPKCCWENGDVIGFHSVKKNTLPKTNTNPSWKHPNKFMMKHPIFSHQKKFTFSLGRKKIQPLLQGHPRFPFRLQVELFVICRLPKRSMVRSEPEVPPAEVASQQGEMRWDDERSLLFFTGCIYSVYIYICKYIYIYVAVDYDEMSRHFVLRFFFSTPGTLTLCK